MDVFDVAVSVIHPNLAISMEPIPGFGKLGTVTLWREGKDNEHVPVYYSGGFFKRVSNLSNIPNIQNEILLMANVYSNKKAMRVNYVTSIRRQLDQLKDIREEYHEQVSVG